MSVQALSWVFDHSESRLAARHVLLSIANHAKANGTGAWPSYSRIAHEARVSEETVRLALPELVSMGELEIESGAGPHGCNLYTLPGVGKTSAQWAEVDDEVGKSTGGVGKSTGQSGQHGLGRTVREPSKEPLEKQPSLTKTTLSSKSPAKEKSEATWSAFIDRFFNLLGATPKKYKALTDAYDKLCEEYGQDAVLEKFEDWVNSKGGRRGFSVDDKKFAAKSFLCDGDAEIFLTNEVIDPHREEEERFPSSTRITSETLEYYRRFPDHAPTWWRRQNGLENDDSEN